MHQVEIVLIRDSTAQIQYKHWRASVHQAPFADSANLPYKTYSATTCLYEKAADALQSNTVLARLKHYHIQPADATLQFYLQCRALHTLQSEVLY